MILSLCDRTGEWARPYEEAGYDVVCLDLSRGDDVRLLFKRNWQVHGILAAPPCTYFAASGAKYQRRDRDMLHGLSIVDACLRAVVIYEPEFWALENPVGTLKRYLGPPTHTFHPSDYGDPYTKKTCLWGNFNRPKMNPVTPVHGSKTNRMSKLQRSVTPSGFAQAFFEANP